MVSRIALTLLLSAGLAGCAGEVLDESAFCLEGSPNDPACCPKGTHVDHLICCPTGFHGVRDVEHPDWMVCEKDKTPADAGTDAEPDAGADAP